MTRALFTTCGRNILPGSEQIANHAHPGHERAFDDIERTLRFLPRFFRVRVDVIDNPFDERVREPFLHRAISPCFIFDCDFAGGFDCFGKFNETLRCVIATIEQHILHALAQRRLDLFVNGELTRVDDSHVEPGANRVIQKRRVHRFAHGVVSAK